MVFRRRKPLGSGSLCASLQPRHILKNRNDPITTEFLIQQCYHHIMLNGKELKRMKRERKAMTSARRYNDFFVVMILTWRHFLSIRHHWETPKLRCVISFQNQRPVSRYRVLITTVLIIHPGTVDLRKLITGLIALHQEYIFNCYMSCSSLQTRASRQAAYVTNTWR